MYKNKRKIFPFSILAVMALIAVFAVGVVAAQDETETAFLGVSLANTEAGVQVVEVLPASPAEAAGLLAQDIITAVDAEPVSQAEEVQAAVAAYNVGDTVAFEITREGEEEPLTVEVILGNRADFVTVTEAAPTFNRGGLSLSYNVTDGTLEIGDISEDSPLYEAGLRSGDVITAINGEPLNLQDFSGIRNRDESVTLTVIRDGEEQAIEISLEQLAGRRGLGGLNFNFTMPEGFREIPFGQGGGRGNNGRGGDNGRGGRGGDNWQFVNPMHMGGGVQLGVTFTLVDEGAQVDEVAADTPAAEAGLEVGDVITAVNGEPVNAATTLRERINLYDAGDEVTLTVVRGDETLEINVTLAENVPTFFRAVPFRQTTPPTQEEVTPTEEPVTEPSV